MKTFRASMTCLIAAAALAATFPPTLAHARPPYKKEFEATYVTADADPNFAKAVDAAKCNVCHVGKNKKNRNAYGEALAKLLQKGDEKDIPKIKAALDDVAKQPADPNKPGSPTFGEVIKSGKLPAGK